MIRKKKGIRVCIVLVFVLAVALTAAQGTAGTVLGQQLGTADGRLIEEGIYKVVLTADSRYVWDIENASEQDGGNLRLWVDNGSDAQKFEFTYDADGYYSIINVNSGKAVDCAEGSDEDGTNIQQYMVNHTDAQRWKPVCTENGSYNFICKCNGKAADIYGGIIARGRNIQMYQQNHTAAQEFRLVSLSEKKEYGLAYYAATLLILVIETVVLINIGYFTNRHVCLMGGDRKHG